MTKHAVSFGVALLVAGVVAPRAGRAQAGPAASTQEALVIPAHLQAGNQRFDASVSGLRAYLESIHSSDPAVYRKLAPDMARLEAREDTAEAVLVGGIVVGLASAVYGVAARDTCAQPSVTDPNFGADSQAWGACNQRNVSRMATFGALGVGTAIVGGVVAYLTFPRRQDLMDLVNKNNRLSKEPLQWQVGYDPVRRFAFSGATVSF
jgi:hypothetical protein